MPRVKPETQVISLEAKGSNEPIKSLRANDSRKWRLPLSKWCDPFKLHYLKYLSSGQM